ncbi:MAG: Asp-tRNA(Asn)/Glu-tRNA(Gln) amidotransferase subunit GatB [Candidatus Kerfeldbacteria bacterium]|nr:Asp-tRNA(Asn)/Glu-tRNA(Gln) amidotransferase subunit GatB [Candidatus Kerfeldbacteria bacterium]
MITPYETVIGLEIHVQLNTASKMFSGDSNADTLEPNVHVSPISLGHPGTLPVVNTQAVDYGIVLGLAMNCDIALFTKFDRKHYFYPDLPKGYQISQYDLPLCSDGELTIYPDNVTPVTINIERIHLEEDAAKNVHAQEATLVDFNRAGSPLAEIVTRPDITDPKTARLFVQELQTLVRYLGISDADMEKGHMRIDANVSLRPVGDTALYPKTEIKNLNSTKTIEKALLFEIQRQTDLWNRNEAPDILETRGWDETQQVTYVQRTKEQAADYRYFPEPDIPPLHFTEDDIERLRGRLPELPLDRRERFMQEYNLSYYDAKVLTTDPAVAEYYEQTISELRSWLSSLDSTEGSDEDIWNQSGRQLCRSACTWLTTEIFGLQTKFQQPFSSLKISPENLAELITLVYEHKVNSSAAQTIMRQMFEHGGDPSQLMQTLNLEQVHDEATLAQACDEIITANPQVVADYQSGKERVLMFLVGKVMKQMNGAANPQTVTDLLRQKLK